MALVTSISTEKHKVRIPASYNSSTNRITLFTGPNGSGKTQLLCGVIAAIRARHGRAPLAPRATVDLSSGCSGVIAQTFSPFSRFSGARPTDLRNSMLTADPEDFYIAIGTNRSTRHSPGSLTRSTLEDAIYRLSTNEKVVFTLFKVMQNLGYREGFYLSYRARGDLSALISIYERSGIDSLHYELGSMQYLRFGSRRSWTDTQIEALISSIETVAHLQASQSTYHLRFNFHEKNIRDFAAMQSLAFLRGTGLLNLEGFYVTEEFGSSPIDIAQTSSGQQQMLCSMLSLACALKNDCVVVIDEPELSLHPTWQYLYMDGLSAVMREFEGCHVLIATHSPIIVQQGSKNGADVIRLSAEGSVRDLTPKLGENRSTSVESTLLGVFQTPITDSVHLANEIFEAIVTGEERERNKPHSLARLHELLSIYSKPGMYDRRSIELIMQAIDCLE